VACAVALMVVLVVVAIVEIRIALNTKGLALWFGY
jgi:hypothetical protein